MAKLDLVLCFVPLCSINFKLIVEKGSISWRPSRHGVDVVMTALGTVRFFGCIRLGIDLTARCSRLGTGTTAS